jgi:fluoride exporter
LLDDLAFAGAAPFPASTEACMAVAILHILIVALAGAVGGLARFWISSLVARRIGERFPWGTMAVNVSGALAIGALAALLPAFGAEGEGVPGLWLALVIGVLGSYTTVSSFSLQTFVLIRERELLPAVLNIAGSVTFCLTAASAGYMAVLWLAVRWTLGS